jgi:simple sugar transport system ATP-binding protein
VNTALQLERIEKRFGRTTALDGASLRVTRGTVHALLGENGAGKTTLMHVAFGMSRPDAGTVTIAGERREIASPSEAIRAGLGMVHQHFMLVPAMTVAENIALGGHGVLSLAHTAQTIRNISQQYGLPIDPDAVVGTLPVGAQQRVEIIKALAHDAQILILDEPTAVLTAQESRELLQQLRHFVTQGGTVVLITHKLRDALEFADEVTVLRRGQTVLTAPSAAVDEVTLASAMIGTAWTPRSSTILEATGGHSGPMGSESNTPQGQVREVLHLAHVSHREGQPSEWLADVSLTVSAGEIVGIAAVEGNGQHALLRILAGRIHATEGTVRIPAHVGFVPEDRHRDALILEYSLTENIELAGVGDRHGYIRWAQSRERANEIVREYTVRASNTQVPVRTLSGGNQQKLVVGRELQVGSHALVLENPTRGLDIQATVDIHQHIRMARDTGMAIVVYSSDLDEVLALADRVVALHAGRLVSSPRDREGVGRAMLGLPMTRS